MPLKKLFHGHAFFIRGLDFQYFQPAFTRLDPKEFLAHGQDGPRPLPFAPARGTLCLDAAFPDDQAMLMMKGVGSGPGESPRILLAISVADCVQSITPSSFFSNGADVARV